MQEKEEEQFPKSEKFLELLKKQNDLLTKLHLTFGEDEEEARQKKIAKFFLRGLSLIAIGISGLFGFWELGVYLKERWEINKLADRYAQVGVELYYTENNTDVAKQFLEKALELSPDNTEYLYLDAYIDGMASVRNLFNLDRPYNASELNEAYEALAKSVILENQKPDSAEPYILRAQIYAALNDNERAKNKLLEAIQLEPDNDFALMRLGVVEYNAGNLLEANKYLNQALSVNPESKWAHLWLGVISSDNSQVSEAMENFSRALEIGPRFDLAHYNIGWNYLSNEPKDYQKAERSFRTALSLNPDYKEAFYGLGMVFGYQRDYKVAKTYLTKSIELDPSFLTALKWRGIVNDELGLFDDALTDFSSAISIDPSQADLYVRRSRTLSKNASFNEALSDLQFARRLDPENHRIQLYLSRLYQKLGRRNSSMKSVNLALRFKPNYADAFARRASLLVESGDFDLAVSEYFNAIKATTYRLDRFHVPIGKIFLKQKQYEKALKHFSKAKGNKCNKFNRLEE